MRYFIKTFGCQMNEHDSEMIAGLLEKEGLKPAQTADEADIIVVNTCSVRESAENHIYGYIGNLKAKKTIDPNTIIVVCGCMAQNQSSAERLKSKARHVDIILGTFQLAMLPKLLKEVKLGSKTLSQRAGDTSDLQMDLPIIRGNKQQAQINIIYGCNNFCTYCIVPYVRGRERSRLSEYILAEAKEAAKEGFKEIMLLGQNVNSYGKDLPQKTSFAQLLQELHKIQGIERIRYMTSHPKDFDKNLLNTIKELPKICRHFHLPVQAGTDKLLKLMNRGYSISYYKDLIKEIKSNFPAASITTDLIVGFPGETEEDFQATLAFLKDCELDMAYTFLYSKRSGTPAAEMPNQLATEVKKSRLQALMQVQNEISLKINQKLIGEELPVLVEGPSKKNPALFNGRTNTNKIVLFPGNKNMIGQIIPVKITATKTWYLSGKPK